MAGCNAPAAVRAGALLAWAVGAVATPRSSEWPLAEALAVMADAQCVIVLLRDLA